MKHLLFIGLLLYSSSLFSQITFQKLYGDTAETGLSVVQTDDGGYILAGHSFSTGSVRLYVIKTDSMGDTLWTKTYGTLSGVPVWINDIRPISDGGYIILAQEDANGSCLIMIDSIGTIIWSKTYGSYYPGINGCVRQTTDQGFIMSGNTAGQAMLVKTDMIGDIEWVKTYGGSSPYGDHASTVEQTEDGGYIFSGGVFSFGAGDRDAYLVKTDSLGDTLWTKTYGDVDNEFASCVKLTDDGGYIFTGRTNGNSLGRKDIYLVKTDSMGDTLWTKTFSRGLGDEGFYVQQTSDRGYIIFGQMGLNASLLKTDSVGNLLWVTEYSSNISEGFSAQQTSDGGYILSGRTFDPGPSYNKVYLFKTDSQGKTGCNEFWSTGNYMTIPDTTYIGSTSTIVSTNPCIIYFNQVLETGPLGTVDVVCMTTGINDGEPEQKGITLFPNPATDELTIDLSSTHGTTSGKTSLIICNLSGEKIIEKEIISAETKIDLTTFNAGVYVVMMRNDHYSSVGKVVMVR